MNKTLSIIAVALFPLVVVSSFFKSSENEILKGTNFNLPVKEVYNSSNSTITADAIEPIKVRVLVNKQVKEIDLENYIIGVVAGEMPASFHKEALKAQAVASRSYAMYKKNLNMKNYDLVDTVSNQVYIEEAAMRKKWGSEYDKYYNRIKDAVNETSNEVLTYDGKVIEAFYCAMSGGKTQDAAQAFSESLEYIKPVESVYDNESIKGFAVTKRIDINNFKNKLKLTCDQVLVNNIKRNSSNYVEEITVCNKKFNGGTFRDKLGLRSSDFIIKVGTQVEITTYGFGHGAGMSQYGANGYAENGYTYEDILKHYYNDVEIANIYSV